MPVEGAAPRRRPSPLPPVLPGYERWVFVDGRFDAALSAPAADSLRHAARTSRDAGEAFAALLDSDNRHARRRLRAGARQRRARRPGAARRAPRRRAGAHRTRLHRQRPRRRAGTSYPRVQVHAGRGAHLRIVERHLSAGAADSVGQRRLRSRAARRCRSSIIAGCRTARDAASCFDTLHRARGRTRAPIACAPSRWAASPRAPRFSSSSPAARARCEFTAASIANGIQTHDVFAEIEHAGAETVTRELYRGIATDRGKLGFNGKMIVREAAPGADSEQSLENPAHRHRRRSLGPPAARDLHRPRARRCTAPPPASSTSRCCSTCCRAASTGARAQTLLQWAFIEDAVSRIDCRRLRAEIEELIAAQLNEVSALDGLLRQAMNANPDHADSYDARARVARLPDPARARCTANRWCSSTAPPPRSARPASSRRSNVYETLHHANVHRGVHQLSQEATAACSNTRASACATS